MNPEFIGTTKKDQLYLIKNYCRKRYFVYILHCSDKTLYVGITNNLIRRCYQHNNPVDDHSYTAKRLPAILVYAESYSYVVHAIEREKQLKGWTNAKKLALISEDFQSVHSFAECKNASSHKIYKTQEL